MTSAFLEDSLPAFLDEAKCHVRETHLEATDHGLLPTVRKYGLHIQELNPANSHVSLEASPVNLQVTL